MVSRKSNGGVPLPFDSLEKIQAGDIRPRRFPGAVDFRNKYFLSLPKNREKFGEQSLGTAVAVGLEGHHQAAFRKGLGQGGKRRANLGGGVAGIAPHQGTP